MDVEEDERVNSNGSDWITSIQEENKDSLKDLSDLAVWTLSSCKVDGEGFGIHDLLSESVEQYWQSDGPQPHTVTVEFQRKTDISYLCLFLDYKTDESYTPSKVVVRLGSSLMHLDEVYDQEFKEPNGWQVIDLRRDGKPTRAFVLQLQVVQNHQSGRDTHIRHMRVIGPRHSRFTPEARAAVHPNMENMPILPIAPISGRIKRMNTLR